MSKSIRTLTLGDTEFTIEQNVNSNTVHTHIETDGGEIIEDSTGGSDCWLNIDKMKVKELQELVICSLLNSISILQEEVKVLR